MSSAANRILKKLKTKNTKPLRNTLASRAASKLSANEIKHILMFGPILTKNIQKNIEHRAGHIRNLNKFMVNYYSRKYK